MRLIDADELMEHAMRDKLDSRELIWQMINNAPTINKPIKPELNWKSYYAFCGSCKQPIVELIVSTIGYIPYKKYRFCPWCGTKIEWGH